MQATRLRNGVLSFAAALALAGCSTSKPAPASTGRLRNVVGTSLIGVQSKTPVDQAGINETAAGLCAGGVWTKSASALAMGRKAASERAQYRPTAGRTQRAAHLNSGSDG